MTCGWSVVPAFFGFGAVWSTAAPWADEVAEVLEPWDRHPLLERMEANRVLHIAGEHALRTAVWDAQARRTRQENVLRRLLESSAFAVAERLSKLRVRARRGAEPVGGLPRRGTSSARGPAPAGPLRRSRTRPGGPLDDQACAGARRGSAATG